MTDGPGKGRLRTDPVPGPRFDSRGSVIAVSAEDDRYRTVRERAMEIARAQRCAVILYDVDAPSLFADPLPTVWSGDGPAERPDGPLDEHALKTVGRPELADQVRRLRATGISAAGWLPSDGGGAALRAYALDVGAAVVVVPTALDGLDALRAAPERPAGGGSPVTFRVIEVEA
jgi:hypothetical protein